METYLQILLSIIGTMVLVLGISNCIYNKYFAPDFSNEDVERRNFLSFMPGLKRQDIEEFQLEEERWTCNICQFHILYTKPICSLCGSKKDIRFYDIHATSISQKPSLSRGNSNNYIQLLSSRASTKTNASRIFSFAFDQVLLPEDLNAQQRSARMRKQWIRQKDSHGHINWQRRFIDTAQVPDAFVIQLNSCNPSGGLSPLLESPRTTHRSSLDSHVISPSKWVPWVPVGAVSPNTTVLGTVISPDTAATLLDISKLPFTFKYAWFLHQVTDLVVPYSELYIKVRVARQYALIEAIANLLSYRDRALCAIIRYEFVGESAQDAGAVQREWYMIISEGLLNEESGLFKILNRDDNSYFINPDSAESIKHTLPTVDHLDAFRAVGRFIGRSLLDGQVIPLHLSPVLLKAILGIPLSFDDLESMDRTVYKSMQYILECENVEDLDLTFSVTETRGNSVVEIDLVENGHVRSVNEGNKLEYVRLMSRYLLFGRNESQLLALIQGVYEVVPPELMMPFDHKEFELILCGLSEVDVQDWKMNTITSSNLESSNALEWFWEIVQEMNQTDRSRLLQFATGSSRVPVQGFKGLTSYDGEICHFTLKGISYACGVYPATHACYNRIDLPLYPSKSMMHEALNMLLLSDPTGFTIE